MHILSQYRELFLSSLINKFSAENLNSQNTLDIVDKEQDLVYIDDFFI